MALSTKRHAHVTCHLGVSILWIFAQSQVELYVITQLVVYRVRGTSRDVDCSTGQRPMEWADEPPERWGSPSRRDIGSPPKAKPIALHAYSEPV